MIAGFASQGTEDIFRARNTAVARRACPPDLWPVARRKLDQLHRANALSELRHPPGNRLEQLHGRLATWHSIRINEQWRIVFRWTGDHAEGVAIVDYHD